ncbi:MAG: hypothetical protein AB7F64_09965 [Gammaproteobacteria bacterium]
MSKMIESMDSITAEHYFKEIVLAKHPSYRLKTVRELFELAQIISEESGIFNEIEHLLETVIKFNKKTTLGITSELRRLDLTALQRKKILKTTETQFIHSKHYFEMLNQWKDKSKKQKAQLVIFKATIAYCKKIVKDRLKALRIHKDPIYRTYRRLKMKW